MSYAPWWRRERNRIIKARRFPKTPKERVAGTAKDKRKSKEHRKNLSLKRIEYAQTPKGRAHYQRHPWRNYEYGNMENSVRSGFGTRISS